MMIVKHQIIFKHCFMERPKILKFKKVLRQWIQLSDSDFLPIFKDSIATKCCFSNVSQSE